MQGTPFYITLRRICSVRASEA